MGKFDGYLICSDLDGTFRDGEKSLKLNFEAVKYFTDNGGRFAFATGRMIDHLRGCGFDKIMNSPAALCNGSIIYDAENDTVIREERLGYTVADFVRAAKPKLHLSGTLYVHSDFPEGYTRSFTFGGASQASDELLAVNPLKIVCAFSTVEEADEFKEFSQSCESFRDTCVTKSWNTGVEFNSTDATKGKGIEFIKAYLGNIHTVIGVGDYENDLSLVTSADIGVAVGNAVEELKSAADMVIKPACDGAIKDLIERIEATL